MLLDGNDLLALSEEEMRRVRFAGVSLIPQGAMNSLNPVMRIGDQIEDIAGAHGQGRTQTDMAEHGSPSCSARSASRRRSRTCSRTS